MYLSGHSLADTWFKARGAHTLELAGRTADEPSIQVLTALIHVQTTIGLVALS